MNVLRSAADAAPAERAVAIGTFDGVHLGHRAVIDAARATGLRTCVVTFSPHPRTVLGYDVRLLTPLARRIELLAALEPDDLLVVDFTPELATKTPEEFVDSVLRPLGTKAVLAGEGFQFGAGRRGDLALLRRLGFEVPHVQLVEGVSSSRIRERLGAGDVAGAATLLGRPPELEGPVVPGDQRGGTLGYPDREPGGRPRDPRTRVRHLRRRGATARRRAARPSTAPRSRSASTRTTAVSSGGSRRSSSTSTATSTAARCASSSGSGSRDERSFGSEAELVEQIARDVEATRAASRPA